MTQITLKSEKILIADRPVDFRKSIDGLCGIIIEQIKENPEKGIYIFYNKSHDKIKILTWHGNGFALLYKRLERGKFRIEQQESLIKIDEQQLAWLIMGLDYQLMHRWKNNCENNNFSAFF